MFGLATNRCQEITRLFAGWLLLGHVAIMWQSRGNHPGNHQLGWWEWVNSGCWEVADDSRVVAGVCQVIGWWLLVEAATAWLSGDGQWWPVGGHYTVAKG